MHVIEALEQHSKFLRSADDHHLSLPTICRAVCDSANDAGAIAGELSSLLPFDRKQQDLLTYKLQFPSSPF